MGRSAQRAAGCVTEIVIGATGGYVVVRRALERPPGREGLTRIIVEAPAQRSIVLDLDQVSVENLIDALLERDT